MRSRTAMAMRVRITAVTRYVSLHRLARREHSHNPLLSHPACHKSEQRRAKSYLGAWGGNIFSECRFGATVPAACQALGRALGLIPLARSTLALGPAL